MISKPSGAQREGVAQSRNGRKVPMEVLVLGLCRSDSPSSKAKIRCNLTKTGQNRYHVHSGSFEGSGVS